jgi:Concanavalin A-like lectin/glucanases superfamily
MDCPTGQICTTTKTCAELNQVDTNKNLFPPDGGFRGAGGASGTDANASCQTGAETCSCYANSTCNTGLTCASNLCVRLGATGGAGGTAGDAKGAGGSTGSGGVTSTAGTDAGTVIGTGGMGGAGGGATSADGGGCPAGSETCACYGNGTCNGGLLCLSNLCVRPLTGGAAGAGGMLGTGGTVNTGGAVIGPDASVGTARDSGTASTSADAPPDVPADAATGADTSASGGAGGAGGTTSTGGTTNTGGITTTGGITSTGGTAATGGITSTGGGTSNAPDAAVDSPAAADATTTPSQTVALFHFDGTNNSTVLTDSSGTGKVATITGNPVISTAQSKFGGASLYVNGDGNSHTNFVRADGGSDFLFSGDFTVDWWQYVVQYTDAFGAFVGLDAPGDENTCSSCVGLSWNSWGANIHSIRYPSDSVTAPSSNSWHHIALTRSASTFRVFADGTLVATDLGITGTLGGVLGITGGSSNGDNGDFNGYIDELRVVKGVAVWTSDFTPPTAPYTAADLLPPDSGVTGAGGTTGSDGGSGLVGYWKFDDENGNVAVDSSGMGNTGTLTNGPLWTTGKVGGALSFDGVDDYVDASDANLPIGNSSATLCAWIRTTQTGEIYYLGWGTRSAGNEIVLGMLDNHMTVESWGGSDEGNTVVNDGNWHHVAGVWNGGSDVTEYVDGVEQTLTSWLGSIDIISSRHLNIGRLINSSYYFNGAIDEVRVYNRALSAAEVSAIFNATK